jgi:hypothetical protein
VSQDEGERIRIPVQELDAPAYGVQEATPPPTDAADVPEGVKRQDPVEEYHKLIRQLLTGERDEAYPDAEGRQTLRENTAAAEKVPSLDDLPPVRKFEEVDPSYEERRLAALAAAQAEPAPPVQEEVAAYLPVGGDAVDLKTAAKLGLIPDDNTLPELNDVPPEPEDENRPVSVARKYLAALEEVFDSIEAIPVEGKDMTVEEFNEAMDRQSRAREAVRKLRRG